jgi:hypothetical protein
MSYLIKIKGTHKLLTDYVVLILSFVIAWIEIWYLDVKIFSEARKTNNSNQSIISTSQQTQHQERLGINYGSLSRHPFSEIGSFYSPLGSAHNSDNENENEAEDTTNLIKRDKKSPTNLQNLSELSFNSQAKEYEKQSKDLIDKIIEIYVKKDGWKIEKIINEDVTIETSIKSQTFSKIGKVFKLESTLTFNVNDILQVLRDEIEIFPEWNKDVKETKVLNRYPNNMLVVYSSVYDHAGVSQ